MTKYDDIPLEKLEVNPANDRHGDLKTEASAIEWLLVNKTDKMRDILQDIVSRKNIIEEPLVMKKDGEDKYIVFDGNRRVTCLKLLKGIAPEGIKNPLDKKIKNIKDNHKIDLDDNFRCRVETDINLVNDILELRHIPGNSGAGRLKWDGHEKETFLERTGKSQKINFAREINRILIEEGYLNSEDRIPLSTFNRLFSSKLFKRKAGVDVEKNQIKLMNDPDTSYKALTRIAKDMMAGKKTLDDVWDNDKKLLYFDELEKENILPSAKNRLKSPKVIKKDDEEPKISPVKPKSPVQHNFLLPTNLPSPVQGEFFSIKFCQLFYELQNKLKFNDHGVAISICFRTFLDVLTNSYLRSHGLYKKNEGFVPRIEKAFLNMSKNKKLPEETRVFIGKLSDENEYFSANTLHKVVHHDMHISDNDLRAYMNNLDAYIREAITSTNNIKKVA